MRATILAGVVLLALPCANWAADVPCDRSCLNGFVDQYPAALVARDPLQLPLTKTARYTGNPQTLKLGDGMWGPVIAMGTYDLKDQPLLNATVAPTDRNTRAEMVSRKMRV